MGNIYSHKSNENVDEYEIPLNPQPEEDNNASLINEDLPDNLQYRPVDQRVYPAMDAPEITIENPNTDDLLRRVSIIIQQHINNGSMRFIKQQQQQQQQQQQLPDALSSNASPRTPTPRTPRTPLSPNEFPDPSDVFNENHFVSTQYEYKIINIPRMQAFTCYEMRKVKRDNKIPTIDNIYSFMKWLYDKAYMCTECIVVSLIYIERLLEFEPRMMLLPCNWRTVLLSSILLAHKVWPDNISKNIDYTLIFPQFTVKSVNELERLFIKYIRWELYISTTVYAKYFFALQSLNVNKNFRQKYMNTVRVNRSSICVNNKLEQRSKDIEDILLSRSI